MTTPFASLDQCIWEQFEKVSRHAYEHLGWNKYDLKTISDRCVGMSGVGFGSYQILDTLLSKSQNLLTSGWTVPSLAMGTAFTVLGALWVRYAPKINQQQELKEYEQISRSGAALQPKFSWDRPSRALMSLFILGAGAYKLATKDASDTQALLAGLTLLSGGSYLSSVTVSDYLQDQILPPRKKKKGLIQALAQRAVRKYLENTWPAPQLIEEEKRK